MIIFTQYKSFLISSDRNLPPALISETSLAAIYHSLATMFSFIILLLLVLCFLPIVSATPCDHLLDLPDEMIWEIVFNLDIRSLKAMVCACKVLAHVIRSNTILPLYLKGVCQPKNGTLKDPITNVSMGHLPDSFVVPCLPSIDTISFSNCMSLHENSLQFLCNFPNIKSFYMQNVSIGKSIVPISHLIKLTHLNLQFSMYIDIYLISKCSNLTTICLSNCEAICNFNDLKNCKELETLVISGCNDIDDLSALGEIPKLKYLDISHCFQITNLLPLGKCKNLKCLNAASTSVDSITPLHTCRKLGMLILDFTYVSDVTNLARYCRELTFLSLKCLPMVRDNIPYSEFSPTCVITHSEYFEE